MTRYNIRIESNKKRANNRIVLTMIRSKIRIVYRSSIQIVLSCSSCREDVISSGMGRVGGCEQEGNVAQAKKGEEDLPRVLAPLAKVVSSRTRNSFWLNSSEVSSPGGDRMRPE